MKLSKEDFCERFDLTEDQFYGRDLINKVSAIEDLEYLPDGISLDCSYKIYLDSLKELPEGCSLKAYYIDLSSLERLPENYLIDAEYVYCNIILPTFKGSPEFFFGHWSEKRFFKDYLYIKESPLKFLRSDDVLEKALAEYFLKNTQENL